MKPGKDLAFYLLAIALERDAGDDIGRVFGCLEHARELSLWQAHADEVAPFAIHESDPVPMTSLTVVHVLFQGGDLAKTCAADKWIGAAGLSFAAQDRATNHLFRFPFRSADQKNDWTGLIQVQQRFV